MKLLKASTLLISLVASTVSFQACGGSGNGNSNGNGDGDTSGDGDGGGGGAPGGGDGGGGGAPGDGDDSMGGGPSIACETECGDDGNPCTEDICNVETGQCGIPRTGNRCDDGVYCNGGDTCDAGECAAHEGDPCLETVCNEGTNTCDCTKIEHCPGSDLGGGKWGELSEYSECGFDQECDEQGFAARTQTVYECLGGSCVSTQTTLIEEPERCLRVTANLLCGEAGAYGGCADEVCDPCTPIRDLSLTGEACSCEGKSGKFARSTQDRMVVYCSY